MSDTIYTGPVHTLEDARPVHTLQSMLPVHSVTDVRPRHTLSVYINESIMFGGRWNNAGVFDINAVWEMS